MQAISNLCSGNIKSLSEAMCRLDQDPRVHEQLRRAGKAADAITRSLGDFREHRAKLDAQLHREALSLLFQQMERKTMAESCPRCGKKMVEKPPR